MRKKSHAASVASSEDVMSLIKEYLSEDRHKLRLFELVGSEIQKVIALTGEDQFPSTAPWSAEGFRERVDRYNTLVRDWTVIEALLGFWATPVLSNSLTLAPKRLADLAGSSGTGGWLSLRWYPCLLLLYAGGVSAVSNRQYANLRALFCARTGGGVSRSGQSESLIVQVVRGFIDVADSFKLLPGHERHYVAHSEYLFNLLKPELDKTFFLSSEYEAAFDRFEVLFALEYAHQTEQSDGRVWGPVGRFGWKFSGNAASNPYQELITEATACGKDWPPAIAGLFKGSPDRFLELAKTYSAHLGRRGW